MFSLYREDIYIGYSMHDFSKEREVLDSKGIKYSYKVINHSGQWLGLGTKRGNFGANNKYDKQYIVTVNKKDYVNAKYWVNVVLKR